MTRFTLLFFLTFLSLSFLLAQENELTKGDLQFSVGAGLVPTYAADGGQTIVPPLLVRADYHLTEKVTVGGFVAYSKTISRPIERLNGTTDVYTSAFTITGLRLAANTNRVKNWNIYGGLSFGYSLPQVGTDTYYTVPDNDRDDAPPASVYGLPASNRFVYSAYVGATHYLTDKLGIYGELGYGVSLLQAGLTFRL